jgi:hypothetical protein
MAFAKARLWSVKRFLNQPMTSSAGKSISDFKQAQISGPPTAKLPVLTADFTTAIPDHPISFW